MWSRATTPSSTTFLRSPAIVAALAKQGLITAGGPPEVLGELIATRHGEMAEGHPAGRDHGRMSIVSRYCSMAGRRLAL